MRVWDVSKTSVGLGHFPYGLVFVIPDCPEGGENGLQVNHIVLFQLLII